MLILVGKGYTITRGKLTNASTIKIGVFFTLYTLAYATLFIYEAEVSLKWNVMSLLLLTIWLSLKIKCWISIFDMGYNGTRQCTTWSIHTSLTFVKNEMDNDYIKYSWRPLLLWENVTLCYSIANRNNFPSQTLWGITWNSGEFHWLFIINFIDILLFDT